MPGRRISFLCGCPFLNYKMAKDAAEDHDRQLFLLKLDEKDTPGLPGIQGAELFNVLDINAMLFG